MFFILYKVIVYSILFMIKGKWFSVVQSSTGTFWKVKFNFCRLFLGYSISDFDKDCGIILLQNPQVSAV